MSVEDTSINEVENASINVTSEFDGLTKSARRRLKKKLVSQSTLNALNSPDTDDNDIVDELSSSEVSIKYEYIIILFVIYSLSNERVHNSAVHHKVL